MNRSCVLPVLAAFFRAQGSALGALAANPSPPAAPGEGDAPGSLSSAGLDVLRADPRRLHRNCDA